MSVNSNRFGSLSKDLSLKRSRLAEGTSLPDVAVSKKKKAFRAG